MPEPTERPRAASLPRWLYAPITWLVLSVVFASQMYWAGYVRPWTRALRTEAVYWLAWGVVSIGVFWLCRRLYRAKSPWPQRALALLLGAIAATLLQSVLGEALQFGVSWLGWKLAFLSDAPAAVFSTLPASAVRVAGINLPIYGALVLAWHAITYHQEIRDHRVQSLELESLLRRAEMQALRSQLNPHFLFNTLHSIAELVTENPPLAEELIVRLGQLLRRALESSNQEQVRLGEELDFVRCYLEIEQMRLGERLQLDWDVAPDVMDAEVPNLLLQPLVENAIQHGIVPTGRPAKLTVRARRANGTLYLQVRDDGPGMRENGPGRAGTGLANTQARLQRLYGDRHRFALINESGLKVEIELPISQEA